MDRYVEERKQNLDQMSITWLLAHSILVLLPWTSWRHWWAKQTHSHPRGWDYQHKDVNHTGLHAPGFPGGMKETGGLGYHGIWLWDFFSLDLNSWGRKINIRQGIVGQKRSMGPTWNCLLFSHELSEIGESDWKEAWTTPSLYLNPSVSVLMGHLVTWRHNKGNPTKHCLLDSPCPLLIGITSSLVGVMLF